MNEEATTIEPIDKSDWGPGPWHEEPDRLEFRHMGLPCIVLRHPSSGHFCGYVGVSPGHPLHRVKYTEYERVGLSVHGGITFSEACGEVRGVCHIPEPGESADAWWFGFDCAHHGDMSPGSEASYRKMRDRKTGNVSMLSRFPMIDTPGAYGTYRTAGYVSEQCRDLAEQLAGKV